MDYLAELQELLLRTTQLLKMQLSAIEQGIDATQSEQWQHCFGKESVVSALGKLVAMHKQLAEQHRLHEEEGEDDIIHPMSDADWELLEQCVLRWRESG